MKKEFLKREFYDSQAVENPYGNNNVNISWSQLSMFYKCPLQYKLKYIDKKSKNPINIHLIFGSAFHTVLQNYLEEMYGNSVKSANELDLDSMLMDEMKKEYLTHQQKGNLLEVTKLEMKEFLLDGVEILKYFKNHRSAYFPSNKSTLLGIETQLHDELKKSSDGSRSLYFLGYIDVFIYDEKEKLLKVIDLKTSTKGWKPYKKSDKNTVDQLVLYKKLLSNKFGVEIDTIEPLFIIFRRKIDSDLMYPPKRIQEFVPPNGSVSVSRLSKRVNKFIDYIFDENLNYRTDVPYPAVSGFRNYNCTFCEFKEQHLLCDPTKRVEKINFNK